MADNNRDDDLCRCIEAQEQTSRAQQATLENIQQMLAQFLNNQNNDNTTCSNHEEEENPDNEPLRLKSQREDPQLMLILSKASKFRLHF